MLGKSPSLLDPRHAAVLALAFLGLHTAVWTLYSTLSNTGALHQDMIEAYSWGREFQLGYYKHPPFWAWIAGAWFEVFPRTNWAFYLLANLNAGIAILGVWQLAGLFTQGMHRLNATLLIVLIPFYTIQGHQYNANYMQLSLWPWTVYFFVISMEHRRLRDAIAFGVLAAAGMLSKYYSALLLMSCFAASFAHPDWRRYYRSPAPYIAVLVCALLFAPHIWWLANNDFLPFKYAEAKTAYPAAKFYTSIITFIIGCIGFNLIGTALILFSRSRGAQRADDAASAPIASNRERFVAILALGPFALTLVAALAGHMRLSTNFAAPIFFLVPLLLIQYFKPQPARLRRLAAAAAGVLYAAALLAAPAIPELLTGVIQQEAKRADEVSRAAMRMWAEVTPLPPRIAAGSEMFAAGTSFYSSEDVSAFFNFDMRLSPWITPAFLARAGFLGICGEDDSACQKRAAELGGPDMVQGHIMLAGKPQKPLSLRIFIQPPKRREAASRKAADMAGPTN